MLPGGTEAAARIHVARAVCRRAERDALAASVNPRAVVYLDRLSDLCSSSRAPSTRPPAATSRSGDLAARADVRRVVRGGLPRLGRRARARDAAAACGPARRREPCRSRRDEHRDQRRSGGGRRVAARAGGAGGLAGRRVDGAPVDAGAIVGRARRRESPRAAALRRDRGRPRLERRDAGAARKRPPSNRAEALAGRRLRVRDRPDRRRHRGHPRNAAHARAARRGRADSPPCGRHQPRRRLRARRRRLAAHAAKLEVEWDLLAVGLAGALPGAWLGARVTGGLSEETIRRLIGAALLVVAAAFAVIAALG